MAKNAKQQAAIAMSMKAAGKTPKMKMGGSTKGKTPMTPAQKKDRKSTRLNSSH